MNDDASGPSDEVAAPEFEQSVMPLFRGVDDLERRREPRFVCDPGTACRIHDPRTGDAWPAAIRNLSAAGICLLAGKHFQPGELFAVELHNAGRGFARKFLAEVRHSDICCPDDSWLHGCRFARPLREEELRALL